MRISTLELFQRGLDGLLNQQRQLSDLQLKIASGKRILNPSDDPVGATRALSLKQNEATINQFIKNAENGQSNLEAEDSTLKAVNNIYQRIRELAVQAGNASLSDNDRQTIALEMAQRLGELEALANEKNGDGEYMFSGSLGQTQTVTRSSNGAYIYKGDEGQRFTKVGASMSIGVTDSGKELFFTVPSEQLNTSTTNGVATQTAASSGLVASGSLSTLDQNELIINDYLITPGISDGVSSTDPSSSALAMANAINSNVLEHGVRAHAQPNVINLGTITAGVLTAGDFSLNGIQITDATGTEASVLAALQNATTQTGVMVTQPGGPGTDVILTANDGRNIQLQTDGTSAANLGNFDLNSGAQDQVQRAALTLRNESNIKIGGSMPSDAGFNAGVVSVTNNTGTGVVSSPVIISTPPDINESYSIIFNAGGTTYDVVADSNPLVPLAGLNDVTYVPGADIEFAGMRLNISGTPNAGDVFGVQIDKPANQDVFTSINNLINTIKNTTDNAQLSYEIGVALDNLNQAETRALEVRAKVGARLNVIESQVDVNESMILLTKENLSQVEDLDLTEAISKLTQRSAALEAAQASYIKIQSLSLFNFIR